MSRNQKILIGVIGGLVLACLCLLLGGGLAFQVVAPLIGEELVIDDPGEVAALSATMLDYELPPGYRNEMGFEILANKMLLVAPEDLAEENAGPIIMIVQVPKDLEIDQDEIRLQVQRSLQRGLRMGNFDLDLELVDKQTATIRGQPVELFIYEGADREGTPVRQVVSQLFEGKSGLVMLLIMGPEAGWDQAEVEAFLQSIR